MGYLIVGLRLFLGGLLLVAGVLKAHDGPVLTAGSIAGYRLLPPPTRGRPRRCRAINGAMPIVPMGNR
jgi:hypothetical protein